MRYTAKNIVVDAYQMTIAGLAHEAAWPVWVDQLVAENKIRFSTDPSEDALARIDTKTGEWAVAADDWLIRMPDGEVTPFPPDLFELIWDAVSNGAPVAPEITAPGVPVTSAVEASSDV